MDYESLTIEELEAENIRLSGERNRIKQEQLALTAVLDRKLAQHEVEIKLAAMSPAERAALTQIVQVQVASAKADAKGTE